MIAQSRYGGYTDSDAVHYNQSLLLVMKQHGLFHVKEEEEEMADYLFH